MCAKKIIELEHRLSLRRLFIDRIVIGFFIASFAFFATLIIEDYKSKDTKDRFFIEKKYNALVSIRDSATEVNSQIFRSILSMCSVNSMDHYKFDYDKIDKSLQRFSAQSSSSMLHFSKLISDHTFRFYNTQRAIAIFLKNSGSVNCELRYFLNDISEFYLSALKFDVGMIDEIEDSFKLSMESPREIEIIGSIKYFKKNYKSWQKDHSSFVTVQ